MESSRDTYERLRAEVEFPEAWRPQAGSPTTLIGEVTAETEIPFTDLATSEERRQAAFVVRDQDGKEWSVAAFHAVLRKELWDHPERGKTKVGDFVALHYRGEGVTGDGRSVHRYRVAVEKKNEDAIPF
jgi:hypothetical protein